MHRIGPGPQTALKAEVVAAPAGAWAAASCAAANASTSTAAMSAGRLIEFLTFIGGLSRWGLLPPLTGVNVLHHLRGCQVCENLALEPLPFWPKWLTSARDRGASSLLGESRRDRLDPRRLSAGRGPARERP